MTEAGAELQRVLRRAPAETVAAFEARARELLARTAAFAKVAPRYGPLKADDPVFIQIEDLKCAAEALQRAWARVGPEARERLLHASEPAGPTDPARRSEQTDPAGLSADEQEKRERERQRRRRREREWLRKRTGMDRLPAEDDDADHLCRIAATALAYRVPAHRPPDPLEWMRVEDVARAWIQAGMYRWYAISAKEGAPFREACRLLTGSMPNRKKVEELRRELGDLATCERGQEAPRTF